LAELAGARLPSDLRARLDGVSLLPLLNGGPDRLPDRMLISHVGRWPNGEAAAHKYAFCSVHWNGYQLVRSETCGQPACQGECRVFRKVTEGATQTIYTKNAGFHYAVNPRQTWSLYDTGQDPAQEHDLAAARPELVRRMAAAYERWWAEVLPSVQASGSRR
jgi:arylsulfatase